MIYFDTCVAIYVVERHPVWGVLVQNLLPDDPNIVMSPLVEMECLVKPLRDNDAAMLKRFEVFFGLYTKVPVIEKVFKDAARLRASQRLKSVDALHLACALHHGCAEFWTNDDRLNQAASKHNLRVVNLSQMT